MGPLIAPLVLVLPIVFFWVLSQFKNDIPFRWTNVAKSYVTFLFLIIGMYGHLISPQKAVDLIPSFFPFRLFSVYASGVLELAFAALLWTRWERPVGIVITIYLLLVLPFNIYGWTLPTNHPNYIDDPYNLYWRVPMQFAFMAFAYFGTCAQVDDSFIAKYRGR